MKTLLTTTAIVLATTVATPALAQDNNQNCAQSWVNVDTDNNGKISKAEADQATSVEFKRIDADGNGTISVVEWADCASPMGDGTRSASASMSGGAKWEGTDFSQADSDKSGDLSASEAAMVSQQGFSGDDKAAGEEAMRSASRFAAIDKDANGLISDQEWSNRQNATIEQRFSALDTDGNGELTEAEFKSFRDERFGQAQQAQTESGEAGDPTVWYYYFYIL